MCLYKLIKDRKDFDPEEERVAYKIFRKDTNSTLKSVYQSAIIPVTRRNEWLEESIFRPYYVGKCLPVFRENKKYCDVIVSKEILITGEEV
jgi:hypothetical protein